MVKEADALTDTGYEVTVLYAYWNDWGTALDKELLPQKKWKAIRTGGDPEQRPFLYFISRLVHKFAKRINRLNIVFFADIAIARPSYFLSREAKKIKADLYIGHNLGALAAAVNAAKNNHALCGFDAEDFHRNEVTNDKTSYDFILKSTVEDKYLPHLNYFSASSPGIALAYKKLYTTLDPVVLLNVFPVDHSVPAPKPSTGKKLSLFWFSQTIGPGRGLEDVIGALTLLNNPHIELHLLGHMPDGGDAFLNTSAVNLVIHKPIPGSEIYGFASQFDIGLAPETNAPLNRDICLTNKIFTYTQAGLAIIASNTNAQAELMGQYPETGRVYENGRIKALAKTIQDYFNNKNELFTARKMSFEAARNQLNWETESKKLIAAINDMLAH